MNYSAKIMRALGGREGAILLALSSAPSVWFAVYGGFVFYSDADVFFINALQISHLSSTNYFFTLGYSILIALTGFTITGSIMPLLVVQAAFAALTPWLAFKTFACFDRRVGLAAGTVCLASLTPFFFETMFYHDGTSLFFGFLSITFAGIFFGVRDARYIYLSVASASFAYITQPAVIGFVVGCGCVFALAAFFDRRQTKHVFLALALCGVALVTATSYVTWSLRHDGSIKIPEQFGRRLFFDVYLEGGAYAQFEGSAAEALRLELVRFFQSDLPAEYVDYIKSRLGASDYQDLFRQYDGRATDLVDRIFAQPNRQYYEALAPIPDLPRGIKDRVFLRAALEFIYHHPATVLRFGWNNFVDFTVGRAWACKGSSIYPACKVPQTVWFFPGSTNEVAPSRGNMPERAYSFLTSRTPSDGVLMRTAEDAWKWEFDHLRPVLLALVLIGWLKSFWWSRPVCWTLSTVVVVYLVNTAVFSLFAGPEFRYQIPGIAVSAFVAGTGVFALVSIISRAIAFYRSPPLNVVDRVCAHPPIAGPVRASD